jgi:hypothetical protein
MHEGKKKFEWNKNNEKSRICFFKKNDEPNAPNTQQIARLPEHAGARGDGVASVDADTLAGIAAAAATAVRRDAVARPHNAADLCHQFFEGSERLGKINYHGWF